jgi:sugar-phosphatase
VLDAVIFDLDGLLIDSEPLWQEAEQRCFGEVGLHLEVADMLQTKGLRLDQVVELWYSRRPWPDPDHAALAERIVATVEDLIAVKGQALPGVLDALDACEKEGLALAVASSSWRRIIDAALARLGIADRFSVVCSAETEPYGKPHPGVFLTTARLLDVDPTRCLVVEDSVLGMVAALAARMRCVAVPDDPGPRFALADEVLGSLEEFPEALARLIR